MTGATPPHKIADILKASFVVDLLNHCVLSWIKIQDNIKTFKIIKLFNSVKWESINCSKFDCSKPVF